MWAPSSISIDNNLSSSKSGIGSWTSEIELARWVNHDFRVNEHVGWDDLLNYQLSELGGDLLVGGSWSVLSRNKDVVYSNWLDSSVWQFFVLNDNLGLAVWSQPWDSSILSEHGHLLANLVSKDVGVWVKSLGIPFIGGITEHQSLVSCSHVQLVLLKMDCCGDLAALGMNIDDNLAILAIKSNVLTSESDLSADSSCNLLEVYLIL